MRTAGTAVVTAVAAALILSACGNDGGDGESTSTTPTASASATASPDATSTAKAAKSEKASDADATSTDEPVAPKPKSAAEIRADDAADQVRTESPKPKKSRKSAPKSAAPVAAPGGYIDYSEYEANRAAYAGSKVVIFFHAPWCPKCRDTEDSINNDGVPSGLTIVKADFDSSTDLRQRYGVTVQHTYVQVDRDGNSLQKWTGSYGDTSVAGIAARV
jgi:thiol-disulfide isomerase/thioredoxin